MAKEQVDKAFQFLEDVNFLYLQCDERSRTSFWRVIKKRRLEKAGLVLAEDKVDGLVMTQRIHQQNQTPSYETGVRLLKTYISQAKKGNEHTKPLLQDWALSGLEAISNGETVEAAFGLRRNKGRPKGSSVYSDLQIACAYHYFLRQGSKKIEAERLVKKHFNIEPRLVEYVKKRFLIPKNIATEVLEVLMEDDYRGLYGEIRN